ncbi:IclR family transcriptional regulator [Microcella alkaliphila]|uniref:IclR family transcriptional regulator n=1 Tax=Microcella alkaliphila TaxID=279828 RepID=A0A4Q7TZS9_9MICO|nr:IclR family transcriptional regulator [Microcella alkaliphila]RZT66483.1 IclR family transcriptional regulator [Microcella alkaliphila]
MAILEKSGAIIAALEDIGEATAQELADTVNEPVSSTYRLLASLSSIGWVDSKFRRGYFRLGVRFVRIGSRLEDRLSVRDACTAALVSLRRDTGATAFLCFRRGDAAVCVERLDGRDVRSLAMRLGDSLPLYRGAAPLAILAFLPEGEREAVLERFAVRRRDGEDVPGDKVLRDAIDLIRARGYSISDEDVTPGIGAVGAPVFNHRGELEGAISVSGLRNAIILGPPDVATLTVEAAADASRALGFGEGLENS